jgi:ribosomal protein S18 acetylase RimI-like enzyme
MPKLEEPIRLVASHKPQATEVLARAFLADPVYATLFPNKTEREQTLRRLYGAIAGYSLVYGVVHTTPAVEGVACWLSPGNTEITWWRALRTGLGLQRAVARFNSQARQDFIAAMAYMDEIRKRKAPGPHWYLWTLGVEPGCQGQRIGGRLIQPVLNQADTDGIPCYLETETESNVAFYQRRGFKVVNDGLLPGRGLRIWTMLREAQS